MEKIKNISPYFKLIKDQWIFTGKKLIIHVPKRYEVYGVLEIGDTIQTLGVVGLEIDDKYQCGFKLLANIEIIASDINEEVIDDLTYVTIELSEGDIFINNKKRIKDGGIPYALFVEYITYGRWPYFIDYDASMELFLNAKKDTGMNLPLDPVTYEFLIAYLSRNPKDISQFYRHTNMKEPAHRLMLRSVEHAPESTMSGLLGSYFDSALLAKVNHQPSDDNNFKIENMFRI